jgi:hypothetical protein
MRCCGTLARLPAYVGAPALLAIVGIHLWNELPVSLASKPSTKAGRSVAVRSYPAFAVNQFDLPEKTETYWIFRDPEGGRTDDFRWAAQGEKAGCRTQNLSPRRRIEPIGGGLH